MYGQKKVNGWTAKTFIERLGQLQERRYARTNNPNLDGGYAAFNAISSVVNLRLSRLLGNTVTDALLAIEARRLARPLLVGTTACALITGLLTVRTLNFWPAIGAVTIGVISLSVGSIFVEKRRETFVDNLLRCDQPPLDAFHKTTRQKAFHRFYDTFPGIALSGHPHRQEILDALTTSDPEIVAIAGALSNEYYGTAQELVATVKTLNT